MMTPEFTTGDELRSHYAGVRRRMLKAGAVGQRKALSEKVRAKRLRRRRTLELKQLYWEHKLTVRRLTHPCRLIATEAASFYGLLYSDIIGERRTTPISWARAVSAFIAWQYWNHDASVVAHRMRLNHSSIFYACRRVAARIQHDVRARVDLMTIISRLKDVLHMADPENVDAFNRRFQGHQRVTGLYEKTTLHLPCPFCAADDWLVTPIIGFRERVTSGAMCIECGRSAKAVFETATQFHIVQTGGDDPPEWHREMMPMSRA